MLILCDGIDFTKNSVNSFFELIDFVDFHELDYIIGGFGLADVFDQFQMVFHWHFVIGYQFFSITETFTI